MTNTNLTKNDSIFILNNAMKFENSIISKAQDEWAKHDGDLNFVNSYIKEYDDTIKQITNQWHHYSDFDSKISVLRNSGFSSEVLKHMVSYFDLKSKSLVNSKKKFKVMFIILILFLLLILIQKFIIGLAFLSVILPEHKTLLSLTILFIGIQIILLIILLIRSKKVILYLIGIVVVIRIIIEVYRDNLTPILLFFNLICFGLLYYLFQRKS